jgi:hypothetical protein
MGKGRKMDKLNVFLDSVKRLLAEKQRFLVIMILSKKALHSL